MDQLLAHSFSLLPNTIEACRIHMNSMIKYLARSWDSFFFERRVKAAVKKGLPVPFVFRGRKYYLNPDESSFYHIRHSTEKLSNMVDLLPKHVDVIFDVGANCGLFSAFSLSACPNATIHCFEPSSELLPIIELNLRHAVGAANVHSVAVSDYSGLVNLYVNPKSQQTNSLSRSAVELFSDTDAPQVRSVRSITLDDFAKKNGIDKIDVLKVDVQGCEGAVLRGCRKLLPSVDMLFLESTWMEIEGITEIVPFALINGFNYISVLNSVYMGADILLHRAAIDSKLIKVSFALRDWDYGGRWL